MQAWQKRGGLEVEENTNQVQMTGGQSRGLGGEKDGGKRRV